MYIHGYKIIIEDVEQLLYYFLLPKSSDDLLNLNMPMIIDERIDKWFKSGLKTDIYLDALNNKYTFIDSVVDRETKCNNRYGTQCRDIYIKYGTMLIGYQKRSK